MIQNEVSHRFETATTVRSTTVRSTTVRSTTVRSLRFLFAAALLLLASASAFAQATLDWSTVVWNDGDLTNTYTLSNGVMVTITVSTAAAGTFTAFGVTSPFEDGPPPATAEFFGTGLDLGILFDPASGQGTSPVITTVTFSQPVTDVAFEISDIDFSVSRIDQVVVSCDGGIPNSFTAKTGTPSFSITGGNTATSDGATSVTAGSDNGTAVVDCGPGAVSTAVITYNEASGVLDPSGRGIGVLFMLTEVPVELMEFSID